jgi:hypothetical protein
MDSDQRAGDLAATLTSMTADPITLTIQASRVLAAAGQSDMVWGHVSAGIRAARG